MAFFLTNDIANRVLVPLLRSRGGRGLGQRLAVVEYTGRRTGRPRRLVAQYHRDGRYVCIDVGMAERKTWWRNFAEPGPIRLLLAGDDRHGVASAHDGDGAVWVTVELELELEPAPQTKGGDKTMWKSRSTGTGVATGVGIGITVALLTGGGSDLGVWIAVGAGVGVAVGSV